MSTLDAPLSIALSSTHEAHSGDAGIYTSTPPESQLGSSFVGLTWDQYVDAQESTAREAKISVIGVTDYMSIDGYEKLFNEKYSLGRLAEVDLLIPNIEFRMMPPTDDGKALNLHLLVDPTEPNHILIVSLIVSQETHS